MKQLELFCTQYEMSESREKLARHLRRYPLRCSYDEVLEWHKEASRLIMIVQAYEQKFTHQKRVQNALERIRLWRCWL